jgi:hypothetical protein
MAEGKNFPIGKQVHNKNGQLRQNFISTFDPQFKSPQRGTKSASRGSKPPDRAKSIRSTEHKPWTAHPRSSALILEKAVETKETTDGCGGTDGGGEQASVQFKWVHWIVALRAVGLNDVSFVLIGVHRCSSVVFILSCNGNCQILRVSA